MKTTALQNTWELQLHPDLQRSVYIESCLHFSLRFIKIALLAKKKKKVLLLCGNDLNPFLWGWRKFNPLFHLRKIWFNLKAKPNLFEKILWVSWIKKEEKNPNREPFYLIFYAMWPLLVRFILCFMYLFEKPSFFMLPCYWCHYTVYALHGEVVGLIEVLLLRCTS